MTQGSILKGITLFFLPILMGSLMQQLYVTVDAMVIGQYLGKEGLAAVDSVFNLCRLPVTFFVGLSAGASIVVAQCFGSRSLERLSRMIHTALLFSVVVGIIMTALGLIVQNQAVVYLNIPSDLAPITLSYLTIYFSGLTFVTVYNVVSGIQRAMGDSTTPFWALGIASFINIVLDLLFVAVFGWGVPGAAFATLLAQAASAVFVVFKLVKGGEAHTSDGKDDETALALQEASRLVVSRLRIHKKELMHIMKLGMPVAVQTSLYTVANMYVQRAINSTGTDNIAAWALTGKFDIIIWLVLEALTVVMTTYCAQNYGAGNRERLLKGVRLTLFISSAVVWLLSVVLYNFALPLGHLFLSESDIEIIQLSATFVAFVAPAYVLIVPSEIYASLIRGMGFTIQPMILTLLSVFVTRIFWIVWMVPNWPLPFDGTVYAQIPGWCFPMDHIHSIMFVYPVSWIAVTLAIGSYYLYFRRRYLSGSSLPQPQVQ